jgi:hypothetical protein
MSPPAGPDDWDRHLLELLLAAHVTQIARDLRNKRWDELQEQGRLASTLAKRPQTDEFIIDAVDVLEMRRNKILAMIKR